MPRPATSTCSWRGFGTVCLLLAFGLLAGPEGNYVFGAIAAGSSANIGSDALVLALVLTSFAFLLGCVAISALPPLNGFVSEWLTFQRSSSAPSCRNGR